MVNDFIYKTPEEEGLSSEKIVEFIQTAAERKINLHSVMIVRNGNILTEAYYKPFDENFMHRLYSCSKTFVSIAIGMLIDEGKLRLDDKIVDLLPEFVHREQGEFMRECTVEDALKMSVPMLTDTYGFEIKDWVGSFFNRVPDLKPSGTIFNYNTSGSFILDVIVEKITGKPFLEYMRPVLDKIGVSKDIWCVQSPDGYSWGGSGVVATTRDFAKFGELILNKGNYKGEQLISKEYMEKATSMQISNYLENANYTYRSSGYGYQIWMHPHGYLLSGMGSQMVYCYPEKNFMFVCTADTQCSADFAPQTLYYMVTDILYKNLCDGALPNNKASNERLQVLIKDLNTNIPFGEKNSPNEKNFDGVKYELADNPMGWKWFRFDFDKDGGTLSYENARGEKKLYFKRNEQVDQAFPETNDYAEQVATPAGRGLRCLVSGSWLEENKFQVRTHFIDINMGSSFMTFGFKGDKVGLFISTRAEFFMRDYLGYAAGKKVN